MVTITMNQIINFRDNGGFFANAHLPLKGAYKLNKIRKAVDKEAEFYAEKFKEIVETYARKDENGEYEFSEDGSQILIKEGMVAECNQAIEDLQNLEIEIENYDLTIDDLGDDLECTPDQLEALMPFMD